MDRYQDWQDERERKRQQKELEKRRAEKPVVTTQLVPARPACRTRTAKPRSQSRAQQEFPAVQAATPVPRTGIERMMAEEGCGSHRRSTVAGLAAAEAGVEVTDRADAEHKPKTTMPKIAGSYKLPPSSLLHRPDEQQAVDEDELKLLAQVLTEKYAEFDVHGQVTQINPGPGRHDLRVQARSRHQVQPHHRI